MVPRKKILFKIDNIVMVEESRDLSLTEIEKLKELVAQECECAIEDVEVETITTDIEVSEDIDCIADGYLVFWRNLEFKPIRGVYCLLKEGTDEYLDAMNNGTLDEHLIFFI